MAAAVLDAPHGGGDLSRHERDIRAETRTWSFRPAFATTTPEGFVSSYDLMNYSYSAQRTFRNSDRVQWIAPRKIYSLYKAQPTYFVLNESAYSISRVNGSQELEETISAGFLRTDLKLLDNRLWIVAGARYERTDDKGTLTTNNAALKPWTADNYDFSVETYSVKGATFSASLFRKNVTGFFVSTRTDATLALLNEMGLSDDYLDDAVITTTNSKDSVKVDGLEWSWRQSLKPLTGLPKWSRGVQLWVNATHLRIGGAGADEFSGYSPRMINRGASYAGAKFLVRYNVSRIARPARIAQRRQRDHARRHLQRAGHPHGPGREYRVSVSPALFPLRLGAQPRQRTAPAHDLLTQRPRLHPAERLHLLRSVVDGGGEGDVLSKGELAGAKHRDAPGASSVAATRLGWVPWNWPVRYRA